MHDFESCAFNHSATLPFTLQRDQGVEGFIHLLLVGHAVVCAWASIAPAHT